MRYEFYYVIDPQVGSSLFENNENSALSSTANSSREWNQSEKLEYKSDTIVILHWNIYYVIRFMKSSRRVGFDPKNLGLTTTAPSSTTVWHSY